MYKKLCKGQFKDQDLFTKYKNKLCH